MRTLIMHVAAAALGASGVIWFHRWRPALPWAYEVRKRRRGAKWRRKVFSFGPGKNNHTHRDRGR